MAGPISNLASSLLLLTLGGGFPSDLVVKNLSVKQEQCVPYLGLKDPLEKDMATHSSILTQKIPWTGDLVGYSPWGRKESYRTEHACTHTPFVPGPTLGSCGSPSINTFFTIDGTHSPLLSYR